MWEVHVFGGRAQGARECYTKVRRDSEVVGLAKTQNQFRAWNLMLQLRGRVPHCETRYSLLILTRFNLILSPARG